METYEVTVKVEFTASHQLPLPDGNTEQAHWHTWDASATFRGQQLDGSMGVLIDFLQVRDALDVIVGEYASKSLNTHEDFATAPPSAELVARAIGQRLAGMLGPQPPLYRLSITEAPGCQAAYYPQGFHA